MPWRSVRDAVLMLGGALIGVQTLVAVLEHSVRPTRVDPGFYAEVQQAQQAAKTARPFGLSIPTRTP